MYPSPQRVAKPNPSSCLISCSTGRCPACLQSSSPNPQDAPQALIDEHLQLLPQSPDRQQLSFKTIGTAFTFGPKTLNLVVSAVDRHIGLNIANACLAFPMRAWMFSSVPPFLLTMLLRYVNSSTSSTCSPSIYRPSPRLVEKRISFVFIAMIFRPTFAPCSSKACILSLMSCTLCDS